MKKITKQLSLNSNFRMITVMMMILTLSFSSCVKKDFDEPPAGGQDPDLKVTHTIAQLKALWSSGIVPITTDIIVAGIVVGDDESGNFYKSIVLQDSTAGINIQIDQADYWRNYQVGRRVFVKCKGLYLGDYGKQVQLGGYIDNSGGSSSVGRIPLSLVQQYLIGGVWGLSTTPLATNNFLTLNPTADQNKLVTLHGVRFAPGSSCQTWADIAGQTSGNRILNDAGGREITVRTSNFATFAAGNTPSDTGTITGVFQQYNSTLQLVIRSINDVQMGSTCCTNPSLISIDSLRKMFVTSPGIVVEECVKIRGIVVSDKVTGNITSKNLMLQDNSTGEQRGIIVRFTSNNTFNMGDEIEVNVSGDSLSKYSGALQIEDVDITKTVKISSGNVVTPKLATIADISANFYNWESTLVRIENVTINAGNVSTYSGNKPLTDATGGGLVLFTSSFATFAGINHPATASSLTGFLTPFNGTFEISIRNTTDVTP